MNDDLLERAVDALRERGEKPDPASRFTRARVMASVHQRRRRRSTLVTLFIPIAAVLVGSSAWAAANGTFSRVWRSVSAAALAPIEAPHADRKTLLGKRVTHSAQSSVERAVTQISSSSAPMSEPSKTSDAENAAASSPIKPVMPAEHSSSGAKSRASTEADDLYRRAHAAHFSARDPSGALKLWDAYLARAPGGRFVQEARYNRALCLVRLGRAREARAALGPFASATFGNYRQKEAQELLDALDGSAAE